LILKILNQQPKPIHGYYSKDLQKLIYLLLDKNCVNRPSCKDVLCLSFVKEKLKELGLYDKIEFINVNKEKNNLRKNYSNGNFFTIKTNLDKYNTNNNKKLLFKNILQRNNINKSYNFNNNINVKNYYKNQALFISKSTDNLKKLKLKKEKENKNNNNGLIIIQKEPKNNYRNYNKKNNISNKVKNNIDEYELKIKSERRNNDINKYPKNTNPNLNFLNLDNEEEIFKNIKTNDILNNKEVDKYINNKLTKMKKEKKEINIKEFANLLNNNITKNNLTNYKYNGNLTNRNEYRFKKIKNKIIDRKINKTNNYSFDINTKLKQDKFRKIEIANIYYNKTNKNKDVKMNKITFNNDYSEILKKNKSFLNKTNKNKKKLNKNGNKIMNRINSALYNHKSIHKIQILDLTNK